MARRNVHFTQGEYYHIYNRGCNKVKIFQEDENYRYLLKYFLRYIREYNISPVAYCLMPNHYHFLIRQDGKKSAGRAFQFLFNRYTKAFNVMYRRTGTLFEGPFKSIHVNRSGYLIYLCRYIHRNPVDAGLVRSPEEWRYSDYKEWIGQRAGALVDREFIKTHFKDPEDYRSFVLAGVEGGPTHLPMLYRGK